MSSRKARRERQRQAATPAAGEPAPPGQAAAHPDLITALSANREATVELYRQVTAHAEQAKDLATALSRHELSLLRVLRGVAEAVDSLDRLLAHGSDVDAQSVLASVRRTGEVLVGVLADNDIELIGRPGEFADPNTHQVIEVVDDRRLPEDAVIAVLRRGLRYRGRLIQPASVILSSGRAAEAAEQPAPVAAGPDSNEEQ